MMQNYFGVILGKGPALRIWFHVRMALGTGENTLRERWPWDWKDIFRWLIFDVIGGALLCSSLLDDD